MSRAARAALVVSWLSFAPLLGADSPRPAPTAVKHREGLVHGFLALRTLEGETLAAGDLIQQARSDVEIGGVSGLLAPLLGKQPPDTHVWILNGEAPAFVKSEGPLSVGGPIWRIELTGPFWPDAKATGEHR